MSDSGNREARQQVLVRAANEELARQHPELRPGTPGRTAFRCECGDAGCDGVVDATHAEYETVRASGSWFLVANRHENPETCRVVRTNDRFSVVETLTAGPRRIVLRANPRHTWPEPAVDRRRLDTEHNRKGSPVATEPSQQYDAKDSSREPPGIRPAPFGRILVLADTSRSDELIAALRGRRLQRRSEILVVGPLVASRLAAFADDDATTRVSHDRVARMVDALTAAGFAARGVVGDSNPRQAVEDTLRGEDVDEVIIVAGDVDGRDALLDGLHTQLQALTDRPVSSVAVAAAAAELPRNAGRLPLVISAAVAVGVALAVAVALGGLVAIIAGALTFPIAYGAVALGLAALNRDDRRGEGPTAPGADATPRRGSARGMLNRFNEKG
jgi:hypothetical protein